VVAIQRELEKGREREQNRLGAEEVAMVPQISSFSCP